MTKKFKKPLSILLTIMMMLSLFVIMPVTSASATHYSYSFPDYFSEGLGKNKVFALGESYTLTFSSSYGELYVDGVLYGKSIKPSGHYFQDETVTIDTDGTMHLHGATYSLEGYKCYSLEYSGSNYDVYWWLYRTNDLSKAITAPVGETLQYTGNAMQLCSAGSTTYGTMQYKLDNGEWSTSVPTATNVGVYTIYYKVVGDMIESDVNQITAEISDTDVYNYTVCDGSGADNVFAKGKIHVVSLANTWYNQFKFDCVYNAQTELTLWDTSYLCDGPARIEADGTLKINGESYSLDDYNAWRIGYYNWLNNYYYYFYRANTSAATIETAPTAKTLYYNGNPQQLVNAGTATDGSMRYSMDNSVWGTAIPTATDVGTYTVYYKASGDASHADSNVGQVTVTIAEPPKYNVTWKNDDGTVLTTYQLESGGVPVYNAETPTKADYAEYSYIFSGWTDGTNVYSVDDILPAVTEDVVYTATFTTASRFEETVEEKAPTCTEDGNIEYFIGHDGKYYTLVGGEYTEVSAQEVVISSPGHTAGSPEKENETAPTYENDGSYEEVTYCSVCGEELSRQTVTVPMRKLINVTELSLSKGQIYSAVLDIPQGDTYTLKSKNTAVVSVNSAGRIVARGEGSTEISITTSSGLSAVCTVEVTDSNDITLDKSELVMNVKDSYTFTATYPDTESCSWKSSDPNVVTVNQSGKIVARGKGSATVYARTQNGIASCEITVNQPPEEIVLDKTELSLNSATKEKYTLKVTLLPENAQTSLTFKSDNPSVASVNSAGRIVARGEGTATVRVISTDGKVATCTVTVS